MIPRRSAAARASVPAVAIALLVLAPPYEPQAQGVRNAGKYGAMFSWWYEALPRQTIEQPTTDWDARRQQWWDAMMRQAVDAGLGWIAAASWGQGSTADPATLEPLLRAIDASGGGLKVALFDDTTSEVLRKNETKHGAWVLDPRFDLADFEGADEGGFAYFYDQQWKRFFATVPDRYRLKINGRPVVFMWHGGIQWYVNHRVFGELLDRLRAATQRDFGVVPFVIVEESWRRLDPDALPDGLYDWFDPPEFATLTEFAGIHVAQVVPGYDCRPCDPPGPFIDRQEGAVFRAALAAVSPRADLVLVEGLVNVDENAQIVEAVTWGRQYMDILRWFSKHAP